MSEDTAVTMSDTVMEQLHCSVCKGFLSCSPIGILRDGSSVCGRCSPSEVIISRALALEAVLSNTTFPCTYRQNGCRKRLLFNQTINHELTCAYRSFVCPSSLECAWKGAMSQIRNHFGAKHPELVKQQSSFKLDVAEDASGTFVIVNNNVTSIVKYLYIANEHNLKYEIRYCNNSITNLSYKLQLINDSNTDCSVNLKTRNCSIYDDSFYDAPKTALDLSKFLSIIDNPNCIRISIGFKVQHINVNTENDSTVNYELLKTLKCGKCYQYLILPLYELNNTICCDCVHGYNSAKLLNNPELIQVVNETSYPCRWHNCESVVNSNNLRNHELKCQFRMYDCLLPYYKNCRNSFRLAEAIDHYKQKHQFECCEKGIFKILLSKICSYKYIISMNILIEYYYETEMDDVFFIRFYSSDLNMTTVTVNFKHEHCKLESKLFEVSGNEATSIKFNDLPFCFSKNKEVGFTVSLLV